MTWLFILAGIAFVAFIAFSFVRGLIKLAVLAGIVLIAFFVARQAGAF